MSRFTFSNFGNLPILARIFWKVPKYLQDIPNKQTYNKIIGIYSPEFNATCIFTHKTNADESIFTIKSDFIFISEKYRVEELCKFTNYTSAQYQINYSFIQKLQEEQMFIYKNKIGNLPINIQNIIKQIEDELEKNKERCVVS
jgi:hypothetical protein